MSISTLLLIVRDVPLLASVDPAPCVPLKFVRLRVTAARARPLPVISVNELSLAALSGANRS